MGPFRWFNRNGGAPPESLHKIYYVALEVLFGEKKITALFKMRPKQIFEVDSGRALTFFSSIPAAAFGCPSMALQIFYIYIL